MSDMARPSAASATADSNERLLGFAVYALHLIALAVFLAPAILGVVIAYARRRETDALIRSHYDFQIRSFWMATVLALLSLALGLATAGSAFADVVYGAAGADGWDAWDWAVFDGDALRPRPLTLMLGLAAVVTALAAGLWLLFTALFGMVRLASGEGIGESRAR